MKNSRVKYNEYHHNKKSQSPNQIHPNNRGHQRKDQHQSILLHFHGLVINAWINIFYRCWSSPNCSCTIHSGKKADECYVIITKTKYIATSIGMRVNYKTRSNRTSHKNQLFGSPNNLLLKNLNDMIKGISVLWRNNTWRNKDISMERKSIIYKKCRIIITYTVETRAYITTIKRFLKTIEINHRNEEQTVTYEKKSKQMTYYKKKKKTVECRGKKMDYNRVSKIARNGKPAGRMSTGSFPKKWCNSYQSQEPNEGWTTQED